MKKIISFILLIFIVVPSFSSSLSTKEINRAINSIIDISYVASSQFLTFKESEIPNIAIRVPEGKYLPDALVIDEVDLNSLLSYFPEQTSKNAVSILSPMNAVVREQLLNSDWKKRESIVTGVAAIVFSKDQSVFSLITSAINGVFPKVGFVTDFTIKGTSFASPVHIEGTFIISAKEDSSLDIKAIKLMINDKEYNLD